jgi:hypothetical protein
VPDCQNPECQAPLDRDAYLLLDTHLQTPVVFCDLCARSAISDHPDRYRPIVEP